MAKKGGIMNNIIKKVYKKVFTFSLLPMTLSVILNGKLSENNEKKDNNVKISYEFLDNTSELKLYFSEDISFEVVKKSLENNLSIDDEYRAYTYEFIDLVKKRFPDIDLTILNENIKIFKVKEITKKEMQKERNREAYYNIESVSIVMHNEHKNIDNKKYCYFHELWHMFNNFYLKKDDVIYYKIPTMFSLDGTAFDEGMTTFLTEEIFSSSFTGYQKQYDEINVLYNTYGEELIKIYLDSGVEGVEIFLSQQIGFSSSYKLMQYMNDELKGEITNPIPIYEILFELYFNHNNINHENMVDILENLLYSSEIKKEILTLFSEKLPQISINEEWSVTFDNENYYMLDDLYFIDCDGIQYLVDNNTLVEFFNTGIIRNIYEQEGIDKRETKVMLRSSFLEYLKYYGEDFIYDEVNHIAYIDSKLINGGSYVKSK